MILKLDLNNQKTAKQILELQKTSYAIEAKMIGFYDIPPLKDTLESIQECDEIFYGFYAEEVLAALISYKIADYVLDIHRVAVHPQFFRKGIAGKLIKYIVEHEPGIKKLVVCTGKENLPAVQLYIKNDFTKVKDIEISKGIYLSEFEKLL